MGLLWFLSKATWLPSFCPGPLVLGSKQGPVSSQYRLPSLLPGDWIFPRVTLWTLFSVKSFPQRWLLIRKTKKIPNQTKLFHQPSPWTLILYPGWKWHSFPIAPLNRWVFLILLIHSRSSPIYQFLRCLVQSWEIWFIFEISNSIRCNFHNLINNTGWAGVRDDAEYTGKGKVKANSSSHVYIAGAGMRLMNSMWVVCIFLSGKAFWVRKLNT